MKKILIFFFFLFAVLGKSYAGNIIFSKGNPDEKTVMLFHFNEGDTSTIPVKDTSRVRNNSNITRLNSAQSTPAGKKFGQSGLYLNATNLQAINILDSASYTIGVQDFCFELFLKRYSVTNNREILGGQSDTVGSVTNCNFQAQIDGANTLTIYQCSGGSIEWVTSTSSITDTNWHHVAFVRSAGATSIYLDGIRIGGPTTLSVQNINNSSYQFGIGRVGEYSGDYFWGYIDEVRFSVGTPRYTSNFTPRTREF